MSRTDDPVLRSSRREAIGAFIVWFVALVYTVGTCVAWGYNRPAAEINYVLGFPDWILWGVIAPWILCAVVTIWFGYRFMSDEQLGEDTDFVAGDDRQDQP